MKTSARNQFFGTVSSIKPGAVNDEVELRLQSGVSLAAVVTRESTQSLGLEVGGKAFALIKASSIIVASDLDGVRLSARNQFKGKIVALTPGAVNAEVVIDIGAGMEIAAIVTMGSASNLGLSVGKEAIALFKASNVILGTMVEE